jgi:hypothetical protein
MFEKAMFLGSCHEIGQCFESEAGGNHAKVALFSFANHWTRSS